ncbi:MAG TPA: response regulator transcription factor [Dehalococcoidia bacterium]|nr:response regulator transcription factor [Dehalococcoidia bacterium]
MPASARIVIVDDDEHIRELASLYLQKEGFEVLWSADGPSAVEQIEKAAPSLVVLDLMLPGGLSGYDVCKQVRLASNVPIIMLTARDEDVDKIVGLELGADDYLTKPFNPRELVARVKAILRRAETAPATGAGSVVRVGALTIDKARREAMVGDRELTLRTKEFDLLAALAENAGIVLTREQLLDRVWGYNFYGETRTVDVHVQHVRARLAESGLGIMTVRGVGYKLVEDSGR